MHEVQVAHDKGSMKSLLHREQVACWELPHSRARAPFGPLQATILPDLVGAGRIIGR